jgi:hypothetical protein
MRWTGVLRCAVAAALLLAGLGAEASARAVTTVCDDAWLIVPAALTGEVDDDILTAVAARAADDAWAVGYWLAGPGNPVHTLVERWDGTAWRIVPSPDPGAAFNALFGVAALGPDDAWAVGSTAKSPSGPFHPLVVHWDGSAWAVVSTPAPPASTDAELFGVSAGGDGSVWAVGYRATDPTVDNQTLTERLDGMGWRLAASPTPEQGVTRLNGVAALDAHTAFAVGIQGPINEGHTLAMARTGDRWRAASRPSVGRPTSMLRAVSALSPASAWAVGFRSESRVVTRALVERFDGRSWQAFPTPSTGSTADELAGVVALSEDRAWAVGWRLTETGERRTLVLRWAGPGQGWVVQPSPNPDSPESRLDAIGADPAGDLWAVGTFIDPGTFAVHPLIEGSCAP